MKTCLQSNKIALHFTNVTGTGAVRLLESLLPAIECCSELSVCEMHLPNRGPLASYKSVKKSIDYKTYMRIFPNSISRVLECLFFSNTLSPLIPVLVFGDIPLRCRAPQVVFVQTPHLLISKKIQISFDFIKFLLARILFRFTSKYADAFIVQTAVMRDGLALAYPSIAKKIFIISQPAPEWILHSNLSKTKKTFFDGSLRLLYPAAGYAHKNHLLLSKINLNDHLFWPIKELKITLGTDENPNPNIPWLQCTGFLSIEKMVDAYADTDALLFLSTHESYGLPLVEAMFLGLPIVCPDLPYARVLCGFDAIYFDPESVYSLNESIITLADRLKKGWKPNWRDQLEKIPSDWGEVAEQMVDVILESTCLKRIDS